MQVNITKMGIEREARIRGKRNKEVSFGFEWNGNKIQLRDSDLILMNVRATRLAIDILNGNEICNVKWRTKDNTVIDFEGAEFMDFFRSVDDYINKVYVESWGAD